MCTEPSEFEYINVYHIVIIRRKEATWNLKGPSWKRTLHWLDIWHKMCALLCDCYNRRTGTTKWWWYQPTLNLDIPNQSKSMKSAYFNQTYHMRWLESRTWHAAFTPKIQRCGSSSVLEVISWTNLLKGHARWYKLVLRNDCYPDEKSCDERCSSYVIYSNQSWSREVVPCHLNIRRQRAQTQPILLRVSLDLEIQSRMHVSQLYDVHATIARQRRWFSGEDCTPTRLDLDPYTQASGRRLSNCRSCHHMPSP